jgi:hypothetical protein
MAKVELKYEGNMITEITRRFYPASVSMGQPSFGSYAFTGDVLNSQPLKKGGRLWMSIEFGEYCPLECIHCAWKKGPARSLISLAHLSETLQSFFDKTHTPEIASISGKEPTITPR